MNGKEWVLSGRYLVKTPIGYGGMATIYGGIDLKTGWEVALKILKLEHTKDEEMIDRFINEARATMVLDHPNIVRVYDVDVDEGVYYIVMELVNGPTLKHLIQEENGVHYEDAVVWMSDICDAVSYAHSHRVIHRDIKPENIMIGKGSIAKITDFGIAKVMVREENRIDQMEEGTEESVFGSVHYIAPEQAQGKNTDEKTDIYSMGCTLYEMLTGRVPFLADTSEQVALKHIREVPIPPKQLRSDLPYSLSSITLKALAKNPENRYPSAHAMQGDLRRVMGEPDGIFADTIDPILENQALVKKPEDPKPSVLRITKLLGAVLASVILLFVIGKTLIDATSPSDMAAIPLVSQLSGIEAEQALIQEGFQVEVKEEYHGEVPEGMVVSLSPDEGSMALRGGSVTLVISLGPEWVLVPDVAGLTVEEAVRLLGEHTLALGEIRYEPNAAPDGKIIGQFPVAQERIGAKSTVAVSVNQVDPKVYGPASVVTGQKALAARNSLLGDGFPYVALREEPNGTEAEKGIVIRQYPAADGSPVTKNQLAILYVGASRELHYELAFDLQVEATEDQLVVVTLTEDGVEYIMLEKAFSTGSHLERVTLKSVSPGTKKMRIYVNGSLKSEQNHTME